MAKFPQSVFSDTADTVPVEAGMGLQSPICWPQRIFRVLDGVLGSLGGLVLAMMLVLVMAAVAVSRLTPFSLIGSDETATWLFLALIFIGLPSVSGSALAMRLDILSARLGPVGYLGCEMISEAAVVMASLVLVSGGISVIALLGGTSPVLGLPEWLRFVPVVVGGILSAVMLFLHHAGSGRWGVATFAVLAGVAAWWVMQHVPTMPVAMPSLIAGGTALLLLLIGTPLPHALICGLSLAVPFGGQLPEPAIVQNVVAGLGRIMLLAIPFFLLAGVLMSLGGLADRLVSFAASLVGHRQSGMAQTVLVTNTLFAGISGSSIADAAFGAKVFTPALVAHGARPERAAAIVAATAILPNIIPPSIAFLLLASVSNLPVGTLFSSGLMAGLVLAVFLALALRLMAVEGTNPPRASGRDRLVAFQRAIPAFGLALIILVCIRFGIMTTTEAAGLAALYALAIALLVGGCRFSALCRAFIQSARETAAVGLLIGASAPFVFLLAVDDLPSLIQGAFAGWSGPLQVLLVANIILLIAGCFLDIGAAILLLAPLLLPVAVKAGLDPVDFGTILVVNLMIGGLTPPVGVLVYVASRLSGLAAGPVFRAVLPLVGTLILALAVLCLFALMRAQPV